MSDQSKKDYERTYKTYYHQNKVSLFQKLVLKVIKDTRTVESKNYDPEGDFKKMVKSFEEDGLCILADRLFVKSMVSGVSYSTDSKPLGVHDLKPDFTYGALELTHSIPGTQPNNCLQVLRSVCPGMEWPFFIIDNKPSNLGTIEAENQARLAGTTIVHAQLQLDAQLHTEDYKRPPGADPTSFSFSAAWVTDSAKIFVHWSEMLEEGVVVFHMNKIGDYYMLRPEEAADFRNDVHNILDWVLLTYVPAAREKFTRIMKPTKGKGKFVNVLGSLKEDSESHDADPGVSQENAGQ